MELLPKDRRYFPRYSRPKFQTVYEPHETDPQETVTRIDQILSAFRRVPNGRQEISVS